jgi:hypothetical protein
VIDLMTLIVLILATMRVTRLVVWDKITLPARAAVINGFTLRVPRTAWRFLWWKGSGVNGKLSYLIHCQPTAT